MPLSDTLTLLRIPHYIKNLFIFAPLFFASELLNTQLLLPTVLAFIAFCLGSSSVYIFNDYCDRESDRQHPLKKHRPLAAKTVSTKMALALAIVLLCLSLIIMLALFRAAGLALLAYFLLNLAYSLYLKNIAFVDISIIAIGFILRLFIGAWVSDIPLSVWILLMSFLLASFLALAKRRDDVLLLQDKQLTTRASIKQYSLKRIDQILKSLAVIITACYFFYTLLSPPETNLQGYLPLSTFFVAIGVLRYLYITLVDENSGSPAELIFTDTILQVSLVFWLITCAWIFYA